MHLQPNRNYVSNDDVQTPPELSCAIVAHFQPRGRILEPCCGDGNFLRALRAFARPTRRRSSDSLFPAFHLPPAFRVSWCELKRGRDFFTWRERVDWIVTNPPWGQFREFLRHAMGVADHVVFLVTINHLWTQARLRDIAAAEFGLKEIVMVDMPKNFPPLGFQLGVVHLAKRWRGPVQLTDWRGTGAARSAQREPEDQVGQRACPSTGSGPRRKSLPSQWMSGAELAALTPVEHLRLILRAA